MLLLLLVSAWLGALCARVYAMCVVCSVLLLCCHHHNSLLSQVECTSLV